jgi:hypothetical protein
MGRYLVDDKMGSLLIDFLRADLNNKYGSGSLVAASFCERISQIEIEFNGIPGHEEMSFLEFLKEKFPGIYK